MLGTIVNTITIVIGGFIGLLFKGKINERISSTIMSGLALCVLYIGISGSLKLDNPLVMIISIAIGAFIGELLDLDKLLNRLGKFIESKVKKGSHNNVSIAEGFVSASLLFCVGAMAVVGALESGLQGNHETLFLKAILDGISAIIFTSSLGIGVIFSSIAVFIYQGTIVCGASILSSLLNATLINNMSAVGSLLIVALALNMLNVTKIKVANLLPSIVIAMFLGVIMM